MRRWSGTTGSRERPCRDGSTRSCASSGARLGSERRPARQDWARDRQGSARRAARSRPIIERDEAGRRTFVARGARGGDRASRSLRGDPPDRDRGAHAAPRRWPYVGAAGPPPAFGVLRREGKEDRAGGRGHRAPLRSGRLLRERGRHADRRANPGRDGGGAVLGGARRSRRSSRSRCGRSPRRAARVVGAGRGCAYRPAAPRERVPRAVSPRRRLTVG